MVNSEPKDSFKRSEDGFTGFSRESSRLPGRPTEAHQPRVFTSPNDVVGSRGSGMRSASYTETPASDANTSDRFIPSHESIVDSAKGYDPLGREATNEGKNRIFGALPAPGPPGRGSSRHPEQVALDAKALAANNRRVPILVGAVCFIIGGLLLSFYFSPLRSGSERLWGNFSQKSNSSVLVTQPVQISHIPKPVKLPPVKVYIVGAVKHPGVYDLPFDSRVEDAVKAAGGMTDEADSYAINLAQRIKDEDKITIYFKRNHAVALDTSESYANEAPAGSYEAPVQDVDRPTAPPETGGGNVSSVNQDSGSGNADPDKPESSATIPLGVKVNVNSSSAEQLQQLKGVGPKLATEIVNYRLCLPNQRFATFEQLGEVPGIGPKKLDELRSHVEL